MKDQLTIGDLIAALEQTSGLPIEKLLTDKIAYADLQLTEYHRIVATKTEFGWTIEGRR